MSFNRFKYKYTALTKQEKEIVQNIKREYTFDVENKAKLTKLLLLDKKVKNIPKSISLAIGIVSTLVLGLGLSMTLVWDMLAWGAVISGVGIIAMACNYTVFKTLRAKLKAKYSQKILTLSDELLQEYDR